MFEHHHHHADQYILSSLCPFSCSIVTTALRIGGILDPEFLLQCQITDKKLQKKIDGLKQIPLKYEPLSSIFDYQEELFLDMDLPYKRKFYDSCEFKQYNSWLNDQNHWNIIHTFNDDLII
ncbi:unnamed protein product [Rotaria socialis]|uniref:Uncharacterized protein n=1 Tax=Rotaria socialis TaxID=392032 RepID=A0A817TMK4_9BILA|nr:unnamed protein product [Rotaria socialis]CAF3298288.1 unnamed protein product [Rotaria socialis]CAF3318143.1 unnamed protein product [Rotaria socialis]CAF3318656.1 unnamed protein product [Rotaria socialis]CAF3357093.1 unnamed protein product [Rotaria socialis]